MMRKQMVVEASRTKSCWERAPSDVAQGGGGGGDWELMFQNESEDFRLESEAYSATPRLMKRSSDAEWTTPPPYTNALTQ